MHRLTAIAISCALILAGGALAAQQPDVPLPDTIPLVPIETAPADSTPACYRVGAIGSITEDEARVAQLTGGIPPSSWLLRRSDPLRLTCLPEATHRRPASVQVLPADVGGFLRTGYEGGRNDGAVWQGKGLSASFNAGVRFQYSVLAVDIAPVLTYQQNADYVILPVTRPGSSPFANPWYPTRLDIPQRFGNESFGRLDLGQSRIAAEIGPLEAGVSNQNLWWGPGVHNALLMTNTAPGFVHGHLSTRRPIGVGIGRLEFSLMGGQLRESEYQDTISTDDEALFRGLVLVFEPNGLENLYLGFARAFVDEWDDPGLGDFLDPLFDSPFTQNNVSEENPLGNSPGSQLISFFGRWVLPASRFELWAEWGREDHSADLEDFLQEPDHTQATVLGFQKVFGTERPVRFGAEWTDLTNFTPPRPERPIASWYTHGIASYTHRGQWLGTATGTGGDSQHFWLDSWWGEGASLGAYVERVRRQEKAYYDTRTSTTIRGHDVEVTLGLRGSTAWRGLDLHAAAEVSHRYNRAFESDANNAGLRFGASWWPGKTDRMRITRQPPAAAPED